MSKITASDVKRLAELAKLSLSDDEVKKYKTDIESILGFVDQLQAVDVSDYEPTDQVSDLTNITRPDELQDFGVDSEGLKKNTKTIGDEFSVERVLN